MALKTSELNARLFGKVDKRRATTQQEAQQAAAQKQPIIELSIAGQAKVEFQLLHIAADEIQHKTQVFADNAREQSFLNEIALSDILTTLKTTGQQYPAVGRWTQENKIEVLDGSRRRMACILAHQPFLIYVASNINRHQAKYLSDVANAHKPLSLYERGKEMQTMLATDDKIDQKELAKRFVCSEALVSGALKAAALPLPILHAYPNVSELGRPTIVKLHRLFFSLHDEEKQQFLAKLPSTPLWKTVSVTGVNRITKEVTILLEKEYLDVKAQQNNTAPHDKAPIEQNGCINERVSYRQKNDALTIHLKKLSEQEKQVVLAFLKERIL